MNMQKLLMYARRILVGRPRRISYRLVEHAGPVEHIEVVRYAD